MALSNHSFIDLTYFNLMSDLDISAGSEEDLRFQNLTNVVTQFMEDFCNRNLKSRSYKYIDDHPEPDDGYEYNPKYAIFDPPPKTIFWFPTYPINSITTFMISDTIISVSTGYSDDTGYFLYSKNGKLVYSYGFDYGYLQNIKVKWNGGYSTIHPEYDELKYLSYLFVKYLWDNDPNDDGLISETLGNYKYTKASEKELSKYFGMPPFIFHSLANYKRITII